MNFIGESQVLVYIVCKNKDEAKIISFDLLDRNLVACCNFIDGVESVYKWEGKICEETECILLAKTIESKFDELQASVLKLHSYTCPAIVYWKFDGGSQNYLQWVKNQIGE